MKYYKYRSLASALDFSRFIEILKNQTLYGARFDKLNDPMEGYFEYKHESSPSVKSMKEKLKDGLICSLSKKKNIGVMWSHYANEHRGCCIEVEISDQEWKKVDVSYQEEPIQIDKLITFEQILAVKSPQWKEEKEVRFVRESATPAPIHVKISNIFWGTRMDENEVEWYNHQVKLYLPELNPVQMNFDDIDFGYNSNRV